jgi:CheY-like chemotaxis protein
VSSLSQANELIKANGNYDLYFIDQHLPNDESLNLIHGIKAMEKPSAIVLMLTPDERNADNLVQNANVDKFLTKPIFASSLVDCLNECIGSDYSQQADNMNGVFSGKTMLLVDDVEINREIVISLLEDTEIAIDCAENGSEALMKVSNNPSKYDIVFMDIQMPVMDGLVATERIRALQSPHCKEVPIIAMTANVYKEDIGNCMAAGMNYHIGKPLAINEVFEALNKFLR